MNIHKYTREHFIPLKCTFDIVYKCNLKCIHCFQEENINNNYLPKIENIFKVIDELKQLGCMEVLLTGGEVFIRDDIFDILSYIKSKKMGVVIFTNATLLTEEKIIKLKEFNIFKIGISVYGSCSEVHDRITKVNGSFEKTINNIKLLKKYCIPVIGKVCLMKDNANDVSNIKNMFETLSVHYEISPFISEGICNDLSPITNRMNDDQVISAARIIGPLPPLPPKSSPVDEFNQQLLCGSGTVIMHIAADGEVYPCMSVHKSAGNAYNKSLRYIWENSEVFNKIRKIRYSDSACSKCDKNLICVRCPGVALEENGDFLGKPKEFCRLTELWEKAFQI